MKKFIYFTGLRWLWLTFLILFIDLTTKQLILNNFQLEESMPLIPFLNLSYAKNPGAAFNFLSNNGTGWKYWFLIFVAISVSILLIIMMYRQNINNKLSNIAYSLIISGALGNVYDRLKYGFVVDFIDFYVSDWHWPVFNIADIAICTGSTIIIFDGFSKKNK